MSKAGDVSANPVTSERAGVRIGSAETGGEVMMVHADFAGAEREVGSADAPLDFGVRALFVRDPDGNLVEFLQLGHGRSPRTCDRG